ncbi:MAG: hypothetical protein WD397_17705 [Wenzhouxiangellaceae bacterium]
MSRLVLHLPLLESLPGGAGRLPPELRRVLARSRRFDGDPREALAALLQCPPIPAPAVLSRLAGPPLSDRERASWWLRFDPVRLVPDLTAVWIDRAIALDFGSDPMRSLTAELQAMFEAEGFAWQPGAGDGFGLLKLEQAPDCAFMAPDAVYGERLDEVLPRGPDAARWRRLINESQMIFHQVRPLDRADQQGVGLWFWGGGTLTGPAPPTRDTPAVRIVDHGDSARVRGLANWLVARLDDSAARFDDAAAPCCYVHWPLQATDIDAALEALVEHWLKPARKALGRGSLREISVLGGSGCWRLGRLDPLAFWRRQAGGFDAGGGSA